MYSYHNRIKQRIRAGELIDSYYTDSYPRIGKALVLVFRTEPFLRPIREYRWEEYEGVIENRRKEKIRSNAVLCEGQQR